MRNPDIEQMLTDENQHIQKLHCIVEDSINEEKLLVNNLLNPPAEVLTPGQKVSDKVARFGGSWKFIIFFMVMLTIWIIYNSLAPEGREFDAYPFILMILLLSCVAALQAPVIMMSQNRKEEKDRMRSENDYMINLKAEIQIRSLHQKVDLLMEEQIKILFDSQAKQFELLKEIDRKLEKLSSK